MKILQVMAGAEHGGAETAFVDMCIALHEAGETVEVVTRPNKIRVPRLEEAGIVVHTLPFGGKIDFYTPWQLKRIISTFKPQIVQTWMSRASEHVRSWKSASGDRRYMVVSRLGGYYKVKHFRNTNYFTTITPDIRRYLIDEGLPGERIRHINNFAETEEVDTPADRAALETPEDAIALLALGRLHTAKAFDVLIRAVADVPEVYLWIAGEGPERKNLENFIDELNLRGRVKLLGWREDRAALLQAADICVFASRYEPFGTVFVQAWAQETPVIVSDADGPRQYVRDGEDGLVVPVDDARKLAEAVKRLAGDKILREKLVQGGLEHYRRAFTKEASVGAYLAFYNEILEKERL